MKHALPLFIVLISFCASSQEIKEVKISNAVLGSLTISTGVLLNSEGRKIARKNRIPCDLDYNSEILQDYEKYALGIDNFISFELRQINISDTPYLILIKKFNDGFYTYASIQRGWNKHVSYCYYVFKQRDAAIVNDKGSIYSKVDIPLITFGRLLYITSNPITAIKYHIQKTSTEKKTDTDRNFLSLRFANHDTNNVRFIFYRTLQFDASSTLEEDLSGHLFGHGIDEIQSMKKAYYVTKTTSILKLFPFPIEHP